MPAKVEERIGELERIMKDLAYAQLKTERNISELTEDLHAFQNEMREDRKRMNKQWGDLANRLGTLAEDIVAPNIPRIVRDYFGCKRGI